MIAGYRRNICKKTIVQPLRHKGSKEGFELYYNLSVFVAELLRKKITTNNRQLSNLAGGIDYDNSKKN